ncbi:MAG: TetR/AcrR family transcriptional regulator [Gemmatimonadales bacterium]|nr:TetR/AcrR family transcriptional regulator [Gemmatimonadales bacterium]MBA3556069.1 TetR/AcrR family transcriptional regulator [Gemmatimonadales bacterium]
MLNNKQACAHSGRVTLSPTAEKQRNPLRTRAAILDAAEKLFASKGFDATSLSEVGTAAGVSRATPAYFFGSKSELYQAVLDRCFAEVREAVRAGRARALASSQGPEAILAGAVSDYFDFLAARPNFVRLIEREALNGGDLLDGVSHLSAGQEALAAISAELGLDDSPSGEAAQLLLSIIALCWFHLIHAHTVAPAVGVTLENVEDLERRRSHIVGLLLNGLAGLDRPVTSILNPSTSHD